MRRLFTLVIVALAIANPAALRLFAGHITELARQQLQPVIGELHSSSNYHPELTTPGYEGKLTLELRETFQTLQANGDLQGARVSLRQVRFVQTNKQPFESPIENSGFYEALIVYDLLAPLTIETGTQLLAASCAHGLARVRVSDGHGVLRTFQCPKRPRSVFNWMYGSL